MKCFNDPKRADVKIIAGEKIIYAHSVILEEKSEYFAQGFSSSIPFGVKGEKLTIFTFQEDGELVFKVLGRMYGHNLVSLTTQEMIDQYYFCDFLQYSEGKNDIRLQYENGVSSNKTLLLTLKEIPEYLKFIDAHNLKISNFINEVLTFPDGGMFVSEEDQKAHEAVSVSKFLLEFIRASIEDTAKRRYAYVYLNIVKFSITGELPLFDTYAVTLLQNSDKLANFECIIKNPFLDQMFKTLQILQNTPRIKKAISEIQPDCIAQLKKK